MSSGDPISGKNPISGVVRFQMNRDSRTGSSLFEINIWMWKYGRPFPSKYSVEEAVALREKRGCRNPEQRERPPSSVGVSRPLSGPPGLARNNIEDSVISGMLISEFI